MTKKDFKLVAATIASLPDHAATLRAAKRSTAHAFAYRFAGEFPRFDFDKFIAACALREEPV